MSVYRVTLFILIIPSCFLTLYVQAKLLPVFAVSACMFQATLSSAIPKLSSFYSPTPQLSFRCSICFYEPDLYKSPWVPYTPALPASSVLIFPPKDFSKSPPVWSRIATAPLPLPLPLVRVTGITLTLSVCSCPCYTLEPKQPPEVSPGSHYVSSVTQTLPSPGWLFSCTSDLMLLLSTWLPSSCGLLGWGQDHPPPVLLCDLSLTHLSFISPPCLPQGPATLAFISWVLKLLQDLVCASLLPGQLFLPPFLPGFYFGSH